METSNQFLAPYYLAFTLSMFEGTNKHNLHNIVCVLMFVLKGLIFF